MADRVVTATELARNLSQLLSEVRFRDVSLEVRRGRERIARVVPIGPPEGFPVTELNALVARLPRLARGDAERFADDLDELDRQVRTGEDPWAS